MIGRGGSLPSGIEEHSASSQRWRSEQKVGQASHETGADCASGVAGCQPINSVLAVGKLSREADLRMQHFCDEQGKRALKSEKTGTGPANNFHNYCNMRLSLQPRRRAFTLVEVIVAVSLAGIGVATTIAALTKINSVASIARNLSGATTVAQNQIDLLLSDSPFNPQKTNPDGSIQIPPELTVGTHVYNNVPIYKEPSSGIIVSGTMTTTVTDISPTYNGYVIPLYQATVTITYSYLSRNYSVTMNTVRTSDI